MSVRLVLRETIRSFCNNIYVNVLLMIQFVICFFLFITFLTYYVDIGNNDEVSRINKINGKKWYSTNIDLSDANVMYKVAQESNGYERINNFYNEITSNEYFEMMTWRSDQGVYFPKETYDEHVDEQQYVNFVPEENYGWNEYIHEFENETVIFLKSVQLNYNAYQYLNIKLADGEGWSAENLSITSENSTIPILLGADYGDCFSVGDTFDLYIPCMALDDWYYKAEVVGILEANQYIPTDNPYKENQTLDNQIICPVGMSIDYEPKTQTLREKYSFSQFSEPLVYSHVSIKDGHSYEEAIRYCNSLAKKYDVYRLVFTSMGFGLSLLQNETETTIHVFTMMTVLIIVFTFFCMAATAINRIQKNIRVYAIYVANGSPMANIILPYILEMFVLFIPAFFVNMWLIRVQSMESQNYMPIVVLAFVIVLVYASACLILSIKLKNINIEELMRRKE